MPIANEGSRLYTHAALQIMNESFEHQHEHSERGCTSTRSGDVSRVLGPMGAGTCLGLCRSHVQKGRARAARPGGKLWRMNPVRNLGVSSP